MKHLFNWKINYNFVLSIIVLLVVLQGLHIIDLAWYWIIFPIWLPIILWMVLAAIWIFSIIFLGLLEALTYNKYKF